MSSIFRLLPLAAAIIALGASTSAFAQSQLQTQITPKMRSEARATMRACRADYRRLCSDVSPGGGRILACLQSHAGQLTSTCAQTLPRTQAAGDSAATGAAPK